MDAADPAAWTALSFQEFGDRSLDMLFSGLLFFDRCYPADPFVARERRQVIPFFQRARIGSQSLPHVCGHGMRYSGCNMPRRRTISFCFCLHLSLCDLCSQNESHDDSVSLNTPCLMLAVRCGPCGFSTRAARHRKGILTVL